MQRSASRSSHRQLVAPFAIFVVAAGAVVLVALRFGGAAFVTRLAAGILMAAAITGTAAVLPSAVHSRARMIAAGAILAFATLVMAALAPNGGEAVASGSIGWTMIWMISRASACGT
jgi:hypothetical protein